MTMHVLPASPTQAPPGPDRVKIDALHLSITREWNNGASANIHLLENGDLGVILARGQEGHKTAHSVPHDVEDTGIVILSPGVDGDHDEVHYQGRGRIDDEELLLQAIETLQACREAVTRVREADPAGERNAFELGRDYERGLHTD
jgi:hypothetical protein